MKCKLEADPCFLLLLEALLRICALCFYMLRLRSCSHKGNRGKSIRGVAGIQMVGRPDKDLS